MAEGDFKFGHLVLGFFGVALVIAAIAAAFSDIFQHGDVPPAVIPALLIMGIPCIIYVVKVRRKI